MAAMYAKDQEITMAKVAIKQYHNRQFGGFTPYGNTTALTYALKTDATGAALNSDSAAALAAGDVVDLGILPEGMRLDDASLFVTTGMTATVTGSLGFVYEDGVDSTEVPQDATYFLSAADVATAGRLRAAGSKLVTLPKPARLVLTVGTANNAKASELHVVVTGELTGPR
jgi:hypothetical protein